MAVVRDGRRFRHEFKFSLTHPDYRLLRSRLGKVMEQDPHAGPDGRYHIRSLYFDDFRNTALYEKQAGVSRRRKYRIRIYNKSDKVIKLECKNKFDQYISKDSASLTRQEADRILDGDVSFLFRSDNALKRAFYLECRRNLLRPNVVVDYHREAYVHEIGNVRITFDIDLRSGIGFTDLFNPDMFTMGVVDEPGVILEVKYDNLLPRHIQGLFPNTIAPRLAIGKFVISKKHRKFNDWEDS